MIESPKLDGAGGALRKLRNSKGLSLKELADRLGWHKGRLSRYENNQLALSISVIERIADALGIVPEVLVLYCLKQRYPKLSLPGSKLGRQLSTLVKELEKLRD